MNTERTHPSSDEAVSNGSRAGSTMNGWSSDELREAGDADEFEIASRRPDGSLRSYVTIWGVRQGDELYVRSAYGSDNPWFQRAIRSGEGRIRAGSVERDVAFEEPRADVADAVTEAYHAKYDRYGPNIVGTVVSPEAVRSTLRLVAR
jgi:hypothetical protein